MENIDTGLPAGVVDAVLNRGELARALNKSEPTITAWIGEGMPVLRQGTNGQAYEFQLSACWRWLKARERADQEKTSAAQQAVQQMRLALIGGNDIADDDRILSPKQRQELYDAERAYLLAAQKRGELVNRIDVAIVFEKVFVIMRDALTSLPDRLEREIGLTGRALDLSIQICDGVLVEVQKEIGDMAQAEQLREAAE